MCNILVIYHTKGVYPLRATVTDHLYCFQKYRADNCYYLNLAVRSVPWYLKKIPIDLIIFHTKFFSLRWNRKKFKKFVRKARPLKQLNAIKVALPQDEFLNTDLVCDFINEFEIDHVFSVAPESEWPKIYDSVDFERVKFSTVLTGYLDDVTITKINALAKRVQSRSIDIGYRSGVAGYWLGRLGLLKEQVGHYFLERSARNGLIMDISTRPEDTFLGDDWYKFLLQCKYTLGVESGASVLDRDGTIRTRTEDYVLQHPQAMFEDAEQVCFPQSDGLLGLAVISPRHLEACVTKTCQVLIEGTYSGILMADKHYVPLKKDFSNIEQVLEIIKEDKQRERIVNNAFQDIVDSGQYKYQHFVDYVVENSLSGKSQPKHGQAMFWGQILHTIMRLNDRLSWVIVAFLVMGKRVLSRISPNLVP